MLKREWERERQMKEVCNEKRKYGKEGDKVKVRKNARKIYKKWKIEREERETRRRKAKGKEKAREVTKSMRKRQRRKWTIKKVKKEESKKLKRYEEDSNEGGKESNGIRKDDRKHEGMKEKISKWRRGKRCVCLRRVLGQVPDTHCFMEAQLMYEAYRCLKLRRKWGQKSLCVICWFFGLWTRISRSSFRFSDWKESHRWPSSVKIIDTAFVFLRKILRILRINGSSTELILRLL